MALQLQFVNQTGLKDDEVFITFQKESPSSTDFSVTYASGTAVKVETDNIMSESLSLAKIGSAGFNVTRMISVAIFTSYGKALTATTTPPSFIGSTGSDYNTAFQPFELTMKDLDVDQGNLTAINYFTAPMKIESYNGGPSGTLLQSKGFSTDATTIAKEIATLVHNNKAAVISNADGDVVRYIGPSSYGIGDHNPYPSLIDYLKAVNEAGQNTKIHNSNAFNVSGENGDTNYNFTLDLIAVSDRNGTIRLDGSIQTTIIEPGNPAKDGPTFEKAEITIDALNTVGYDFVLYGQAIDPDALTWGEGWEKLEAYMEEVGLDKQGAFNITQNLAIGEISSGVLMGFINSDYKPAGSEQALKDMPSKAWWSLDPVVAFSDIQNNNAYYNSYANIIYKASKNEAYSIPYSDRLGSGPLINSVSFDGQKVDTWVVTLLPPIPKKKINLTQGQDVE